MTSMSEIENEGREQYEAHRTTLDRDVRFTPEQITATAHAVRKRRYALQRSIEKARENARAGATIQHGTLDSHVAELAALDRVAENLEAARRLASWSPDPELRYGVSDPGPGREVYTGGIRDVEQEGSTTLEPR